MTCRGDGDGTIGHHMRWLTLLGITSAGGSGTRLHAISGFTVEGAVGVLTVQWGSPDQKWHLTGPDRGAHLSGEGLCRHSSAPPEPQSSSLGRSRARLEVCQVGDAAVWD